MVGEEEIKRLLEEASREGKRGAGGKAGGGFLVLAWLLVSALACWLFWRMQTEK